MQQSGSKNGLMAELNVTPLVDVMLVLLVVFMVTVPLIVPQTMKVNLPRTVDLQKDKQVVTSELAVLANGNLIYDGEPITDEQLREKLKSSANKPNYQLQVQADKTVQYGRIAEIMAYAQSSGVAKIGFSTISDKAR